MEPRTKKKGGKINNMEREFIPYEQAIDLKELGFDEPCLKTMLDFDITYESNIKMPLKQQAFRFFREEYNIASFIQRYQGEVFDYEINSDIFKEVTDFKDGYFDTYEEAELACLKKLIEIVKGL